MEKELEITANNEYSGSEGTCPVCGYDNLDYNDTNMDEALTYKFTCPNCQSSGRECYSINYQTSIIDNYGTSINKEMPSC